MSLGVFAKDDVTPTEESIPATITVLRLFRIKFSTCIEGSFNELIYCLKATIMAFKQFSKGKTFGKSSSKFNFEPLYQEVF